MKKSFSLLALFAILIMAFTSCTVDEKKAVPLNDIDLAIEEVFAEDIMEDVMTESYDILFDAFEYGILKSDEEAEGPKCRTKTIEYPEGEPWPKVVTLDFGEECIDGRGDVRSGKIIITKVGVLKEEGSTRSITFDNYYVNGNKIEGTKTLTNEGRTDGFIVFSIEVSKSKILRNDGTVITRDGLKTRAWIEGEETRESRDDVFLINGMIDKVLRDGLEITKSIDMLVRARNCRFPLSGIVTLTLADGTYLCTIDYGEGECDKWATVTIGEGDEAEEWIVNLREKGKKWVKKEENDEGEEKEEGSDTDG